MALDFSSDVKKHSVGQNIRWLMWNQKVHHCGQKKPALASYPEPGKFRSHNQNAFL
jgi:hypothetical protein